MEALEVQLEKAELEYQKAKDDFDVLDDSLKDSLAVLKVELMANENKMSNVLAEDTARSTIAWKTIKIGWAEAKKTYGEKMCRYRHLLRVWDLMINGMSFEKERIKRGI